ncbi:hypothetical protein CG724_33780 [Streptomyces sp. CB02120-2]|nr:hypothetical protein CG724_33780 [Streptomyces sp. CB02120-2]
MRCAGCSTTGAAGVGSVGLPVARMVRCGMLRAQAWQASARLQTWPTAGLWTRTRRLGPAQWTRSSWRAHWALPQLQAALGRAPARRPWALACSAAKRRMLAASFERGGIRHAAVVQVTDTV